MWYLRTLGGLSIETDGGPVAALVTRRRPLALLAALAVAGERGLNRERIVALLWPESDEERGRNSLSQALGVLRRDAASDDAILGASALRLNPLVVASDIAEFERCVASAEFERAADLYRGPFLEEFYLRDAADFERWTSDHRRRLHDMAAACLQRLAQTAAGRLNCQDAIGWWKRLAALEPTSAEAASGLISSFAALGDTTAARKHYRVYEELIRQEFGVGPEPAVATLAASVFGDSIHQAVQPAALQQRPHHSEQPDRPLAHQDLPALDEESSKPAAVVAMPNASEEPSNGRAETSALPETPARRRRFVGPMAIGLLAVIAVSVAAVAWRGREPAAKQSIVVLGLTPASHDSVVERWERAAVDEISTALAEAQLGRIVQTRSSGFSSANCPDPTLVDDVSAARLARGSGASVALLTAVSREADTLEFRAQLIEASTGRILRVIRPIRGTSISGTANIQELRQRATGAVATVFDRRAASIMGNGTLAPRYPAYALFMSGLTEFEANRYDEAAKLFDRAYHRDTTFVAPLIWSNFATGYQSQTDKQDSAIAWLVNQRERFANADQFGIDYFVARQRRDAAGMLYALKRASAELPGSEWSYYLAVAERMSGNFTSADAALSLVDPIEGWARGWGSYWSTVSVIYRDLGRTEELLRVLRTARAALPGVNPIAALEVFTLYDLGRDAEFWRALKEYEAADWWTPPYSGANLLVTLVLHPHNDRFRYAIAEECVRWLRQPRPIASLGWTDRKVVEAQCLYQGENYEQAARVWRSLVDSAEAGAKGADSAAGAQNRRSNWIRLGTALALNGQREEAETIKRHATELPRPSGSLGPEDYALLMARLAAALGERDQAMDLALQARMCCGRPHPTGTLGISVFDPALKRFRSDSALLDAFGFPGVRFASGDTVPARK